MIHHDFVVTFKLAAQRIGQQFLRHVAGKVIRSRRVRFSTLSCVSRAGTFGGGGGTCSPSTCSSTHTPRLTGLVRLGNEVTARMPGIPRIPPRLASVSFTLRHRDPVTFLSRP